MKIPNRVLGAGILTLIKLLGPLGMIMIEIGTKKDLQVGVNKIVWGATQFPGDPVEGRKLILFWPGRTCTHPSNWASMKKWVVELNQTPHIPYSVNRL